MQYVVILSNLFDAEGRRSLYYAAMHHLRLLLKNENTSGLFLQAYITNSKVMYFNRKNDDNHDNTEIEIMIFIIHYEMRYLIL